MATQDISFELSMNTEKVEKQAKDLNKELNAIFKVTGDKQLSSKIMGVTNKMEKQQYRLYQLTQKLSEATTTVYTKDYAKLEAKSKRIFEEIQGWQQKIAKWEEQGYVPHGGRGGKSTLTGEKMDAHIDKTKAKIETLQQQLSSVDGTMKQLVADGKAFTMQANEEEAQKITREMEFLEKQLKANIVHLYETDKETAELVSNTALVESLMDNTGDRTNYLATQFRALTQASQDEATAIGDCDESMAEFVGNSIALQRIQRITNGIANVFRKLANIIEVIANKIWDLAKTGFKKLGNSIKNVTKNMIQLNKESKEHEFSTKRLVNTMLKYGLGIRSVFILWRKLRAYAVDALKLMAQQFEEIDATVSNIINSFNQFKNSIGTLVEPLMSTFAPLLESILGLLTRVNTALANFFAILTGRTYIYQAKKSNESYAESLKKVGKAAKEAEEDIAAYDKLLVINRDHANGNGSGNGDDDELVDAFEKTLAHSRFAEQIKEAIANDDWEGVGSLFAGKLNIITYSLNNWITTKFGPGSKTWAGRIASVLNGAIRDYDWSTLGVTLGKGTNAIFDAINTFLTRFDSLKLGQQIGTSIGKWFETTDFTLIGQTVANKFNTWYNLWNGVVTELPWDTIGDQIAKGVNGFTSTVNTEKLGENIAKTINGGFELLKNFADKVHWDQVGTFISNGINGFFHSFKGKEFGQSLNSIVLGIIQGLNTALENLDGEEVGEKVGDVIEGIDIAAIAGGIAELFFNALKAAVKILKGMIKDPKVFGKIILTLAGILTIKWAIAGGVALATALTSFIATALGAGAKVAAASALGLSFGTVGAIAGVVIGIALLAKIVVSWDALMETGEKFTLKALQKHFQKKIDKEMKNFDKGLELDLDRSDDTGVSTNKELKETSDNLRELNKQYREVIENRNKSKYELPSYIKLLTTQAQATSLIVKETSSLPKSTQTDIMINLMKDGEFNLNWALEHLDEIPESLLTKLSFINEDTNEIINAKQLLDRIPKTVTTDVKANTSDVDNAAKKVAQEKTNMAKPVTIPITTTKWGELKPVVTNMLNNLKGLINTDFIDKLNSSFSQPFTIGGSMGTILNSLGLKVPRLAQGAIIPANREFLAMLGDQKQGTNVEAPLDTIVEAMQIALANSGGGHGDINLYLDGKQISQVVWNETEKRYKQTGVRFA